MSFFAKAQRTLIIIFLGLHASFSYGYLKDEVGLISNIAYGKAERQVLDVYYPTAKTENAPVIFMVHGGAWRTGDKASRAVIKNKVAHWVPKGFIFISVNYRLLPKTDPLEQAEDVTKALGFAQKRAREWGGSPDKFILMGHSAGAHLISLVSVNQDASIKPWLGTIALDTSAYDVVSVMRGKRPSNLYKRAFGRNPEYWKNASPLHQLSDALPPFLAVCSSTRKDDSCATAKRFIEKAEAFGSKTKLLPIPFSHRKINAALGQDACYTGEVNAFIQQLHPSTKSLLTTQTTSDHETTKNCAR